ncbi:hypothetical protein PUMCH_000778 [Australozyma saopauloensis]|uniref:Fe2OG dioxygenase domain-containing protein n=1 Tax=Australozyma saopauloensis TaxID=291208 RepID=A0AAX4H4Q4_9ASCO|nr:hypothetical protein PUMCH_000778 [[Candida] saopauloensis]
MALIRSLDLLDAFELEHRQVFLDDLRGALIELGFFILTNFSQYGPSQADFDAITNEALKFFSSPKNVKEEIEMINSPHFLGYTRLGNEITAKQKDWREQIDLATELPAPDKHLPTYRQIEGPNLWPDAKVLPQFRHIVEDYIRKMTVLSETIRKLVACALGLDENAFEFLFKKNQQCKMKLVSYPERSASLEEAESGQGVGPHRDSDFLTYIYQATEHQNTLQVQSYKGDWISVGHVKGSLVVNAGQTLEAISSGVCKASIHRVNSPQPGSGTRISIPFFLTINLDSYKTTITGFSNKTIAMKEERDNIINEWGADVGFQFAPQVDKEPVGQAVFLNRIKAHQDVAKRWYPDILENVLKQF